MEAALYDPDAGFFARGGGAGRAGADFLTSPEVGALYGALVARALDEWWARLDRPDPFIVVDAGAGRGQLARDVLRATPGCRNALRYVLVEHSAALRQAEAEHLPLEPAALALGPAVRPDPDEEAVTVPGLGPVVTALAELPAGPLTGVVVANELLDNLPFRIVEAAGDGRWLEVRVAAGSPRRFVEMTVPADDALAAEADGLVDGLSVPAGFRLPIPTGLVAWVHDCGVMLRRGVVAVVDYGDSVEGFLARGWGFGDTPGPGGFGDSSGPGRGWLRTYRGQRRGGHPLEDPGTQDITADVPLGRLRRAAAQAGFAVLDEMTQAEWLRSLGIEALVEEARAAWHGRSATDLSALAARSRVSEAEALLDPAGLGAHRVMILGKGVS